jgi:hypothetical protein
MEHMGLLVEQASVLPKNHEVRLQIFKIYSFKKNRNETEKLVGMYRDTIS